MDRSGALESTAIDTVERGTALSEVVSCAPVISGAKFDRALFEHSEVRREENDRTLGLMGITRGNLREFLVDTPYLITTLRKVC